MKIHLRGNRRLRRRVVTVAAFIALAPAAVAAAADVRRPARSDTGEVIRTNRYTLLSVEEKLRRQDPLRAVVDVRFGGEVATVGDAVSQLLEGSGYRLTYPSRKNCMLVHRLLFVQPLPDSLRRLGPVPRRAGLESVVGKAWEIQPRELGRMVQLRVRREHYDENVISRFAEDSSYRGAWNGGGRGAFFIPFGIAEFYSLSKQAQDTVSAIADAAGKTGGIHIKGHSHSRSNWANKNQARRRAELVRRALLKEGVHPDRMRVSTAVSNHNKRARDLLHGVEVFLMANTKAKNGGGQADAENCPASAFAALPGRGEEKGGEKALPFSVQAGSLRKNVERLLAHFGMHMGAWALSDGEYEYDWQIPYDYNIPAYSPDEAFAALLGNYGIQPTLNIKDNSVDFSMLYSPRRHQGKR